jgi:hypothetical protein
MRTPLQELTDALAPVARSVMLEHFTPNCCVATCRVLRRVFQHFDYDAEPVPCFVYAFNAAMVKLLSTGIRFPEDQKERSRFFALFGAWGVGIIPASSAGNEKTHFGGHVVLRVNRLLIDASLQQVDRPEMKLHVPALIAAEPAQEFFLPAHGQRFEHNLRSGTQIVYQRSANYSFRFAPDWQRKGSPYVDAISKIINETKARLGERRAYG